MPVNPYYRLTIELGIRLVDIPTLHLDDIGRVSRLLEHTLMSALLDVIDPGHDTYQESESIVNVRQFVLESDAKQKIVSTLGLP